MVSKVWLDKLPPDLQKMVIDVGHETQVQAPPRGSRSSPRAWTRNGQEMGGQMHMLPPEDLAKMKALLQSVGDDVSKDQPAVLATAEEGARGRGQALNAGPGTAWASASCGH